MPYRGTWQYLSRRTWSYFTVLVHTIVPWCLVPYIISSWFTVSTSLLSYYTVLKINPVPYHIPEFVGDPINPIPERVVHAVRLPGLHRFYSAIPHSTVLTYPLPYTQVPNQYRIPEWVVHAVRFPGQGTHRSLVPQAQLLQDLTAKIDLICFFVSIYSCNIID